MKLKYKLGVAAFALIAFTSCEVNDPFSDIMEVGQPVPTVYWSISSTVVDAGDNIEFSGKYYTDKDHTPDHAEIWETVVNNETATVTLGALTSSLKYSQTVNVVDTVRTSLTATYPHSLAKWNGTEWQLDNSFPVSQTLKSVKWANIKVWDQKKFNDYYPANFEEEFLTAVYDYLINNSTYLNDLRSVYIGYDFTAEQFAAINAAHAGYELPTVTDSGEKSDQWVVNTENVVAKYWIEIVGEGDSKTKIEHVVSLEQAAADPSKNYYDVYESPKWVFCRYDDDKGAIVTTLVAEYAPVFTDLIKLIPFTSWILTEDNTYNVDFSRQYKINYTFKVVDTAGNVGYTTDNKEVTIN